MPDLQQRQLSCERLRGPAVQHCCFLDPSAAWPMHYVNYRMGVEICSWLTRVLHRHQETSMTSPLVGLLQIVKAVALRKYLLTWKGQRCLQGRETSASNQNDHTQAPNKNASLKVPCCQAKKDFTSQQSARLKIPLTRRDPPAHGENI